MQYFKKWFPLIILLLLLTIVYFSGLTDLISYESLKTNRIKLLQYVQNHFVYASLIYIGIYIAVTVLSIPGAVFLTIFGGFFFDQPIATIYVVVSATIGATLIFLAARYALHDFFEKKLGSYLKRFKQTIQNHSGSYLLFLRLIPLFPFWLMNLAPAFFQVKIGTFIWTTFVGIIPGSFVFSQAGAGLGSIFERGEDFTVSNVLNWEIRIALIGIALLAILPLVIKKSIEKILN